MMNKLDELDILIHHKMSKTANGRGKSNVTINDYRPVYDAVPKQNTEYQYWKYTEVLLPVWLLK